jgi:hypothetical protein
MTMTLDEFRLATKNMGLCPESNGWLNAQNLTDVATAWDKVEPVGWYATFLLMLVPRKRSLASTIVNIGQDVVTVWRDTLAGYTSAPPLHTEPPIFNAPAYLDEELAYFSTEENAVSCARHICEILQSGPTNLSAYILGLYGREKSDEALALFEAAVRDAVLAHVTAADVQDILETQP